MSDFKSLGLLSWLCDHLKSLKITKPTDVQANCIPAILKEKSDVLGCAETGSGKTAAFALPILNELSKDPFGIYAIVLSPTQELCHQIAESFSLLGRPINVKVVECLGGQDMVDQANLLAQKPHIVVATPGRLADHLRLDKRRLRLSQIQFLVLDEADRLLDRIDSHFEEDLEVLFEALPPPEKRRTLMFSATLTETLEEIKAVSKRKPFLYEQQSTISKLATAANIADRSETTVETVNLPDTLHLKYLPIQESIKDAHLLQFLDEYRVDGGNRGLTIIFTKTCKTCQILGMVLTQCGHHSVMLHSEMKHKERMATLNKFKSANVKTLVATDVASRGLDIPSCSLVINHNIPADEKTFVHRVGRTARAGKTGTAISLISSQDIDRIQNIEKYVNRQMEEIDPNDDAVSKLMIKVRMLRADAELKLQKDDFGKRKRKYKGATQKKNNNASKMTKVQKTNDSRFSSDS